MFGFDQTFIKQLTAGDQQSFSRYYVESVDVFHRYIQGRYSMTTVEREDILSSFYVKLWKVLPRFSGDANQFPSYVWTILNNHIKDYFKKKSDYHFAQYNNEDTTIEDDLIADDDVAELFAQQFDFDRIQDAMSHLDDISYEIIHLKYIEEYDYAHISSLLELSQAAIRKRVSRSLNELKRLLQQDGD